MSAAGARRSAVQRDGFSELRPAELLAALVNRTFCEGGLAVMNEKVTLEIFTDYV
jgi:hypothetical protein